MRALVQRVSSASVSIGDRPYSSIKAGLLVFFCAMEADHLELVDRLAQKIFRLRVFRDEDGKTNRDIAQAGGAILIVSQFTLAADTRRGNRPGFSRAASPENGLMLYRAFVERMKRTGLEVMTGSYGAEMQVALVNDGPMTIWIDTDEWKKA